MISNLKTLIVEDNTAFRDVLKEKLRAVFPSLVIGEAADGCEALEKAETLKPDLVFMDIRLPEENGIQLTQQIVTRHPNTKVIFLTGHDSPEYRKAAFQAGGICYILKDSLNYVQFEKLIKSLVS